jgi:murein L,D-transpeptidase YcbB/YkuD
MISNEERREELLADAVTEGLAPEREAELARLLRRSAGTSRDAIETAAAAAAIVFASQAQSVRVPVSLSKRLEREADSFVANQRRGQRRIGSATTGGASSSVVDLTGPEEARPLNDNAAPARVWPWLAAAAAVLFVVQSARLHFSEQRAVGTQVTSNEARATELHCTSAAAPGASASSPVITVHLGPKGDTGELEIGAAAPGKYRCRAPENAAVKSK